MVTSYPSFIGKLDIYLCYGLLANLLITYMYYYFPILIISLVAFKHLNQCLTTLLGTLKFLKNTPVRFVLSTLFPVFGKMSNKEFRAWYITWNPIIVCATEREINQSVSVLADRKKRVPPSSKHSEIPSTARPSQERKGAGDYLVRGKWRELFLSR